MMIPGSNLALRSGEEREAPSAIINACRNIALWHLVIALTFLTLAFTVPWFLMEQFETRRALLVLRGYPEPPRDFTLTAVFSGISLAAALSMFRSWYGLFSFARHRRASEVRRALNCLRWGWIVMAFITLAATGWFGHWLYTAFFSAPEAAAG